MPSRSGSSLVLDIHDDDSVEQLKTELSYWLSAKVDTKLVRAANRSRVATKFHFEPLSDRPCGPASNFVLKQSNAKYDIGRSCFDIEVSQQIFGNSQAPAGSSLYPVALSSKSNDPYYWQLYKVQQSSSGLKPSTSDKRVWALAGHADGA
jgi:hypothetical protein